MKKIKYKDRGLFDEFEKANDRSNSLIQKYKDRQVELENTSLSRSEKILLDRAHKWMKKLRVHPDERYNLTKKTLKNLIIDIFYLELSSYSVFKELSNTLAAEGADIENFDTRLIEKHLDKFKEIYFVYYLYNELGMGHLTDSVIQSIIFGKEKDNNKDILQALKQLAIKQRKQITSEESSNKKIPSNRKIKSKKESSLVPDKKIQSRDNSLMLFDMK